MVLIVDIPKGIHGITATDLLGRGAAIWFTNIIIFSLWYWELDRGGPAERAAGADVAPSFAFPENAAPELVPAGWSPSTRLPVPRLHQRRRRSARRTRLPVQTWAKMTMLVQSVLSLVTAILVIARAINVLPG